MDLAGTNLLQPLFLPPLAPFRVVAGMFSDKNVYREVVSLFYVVTKELEHKLTDLRDDEIVKKLKTLNYAFTPGYEKDMLTLYSSDWEAKIQELVDENSVVAEYIAKVRSIKTGQEVAGALFVLWGALVIGGGAIASRRVLKLCGPEATHVFADVTGPGRAERREKFIQVWDSLSSDDDEPSFQAICTSCQECMAMNNRILASVKVKPWWRKYVLMVCVCLLALLIECVRRSWT